jgi:hypothetical protein
VVLCAAAVGLSFACAETPVTPAGDQSGALPAPRGDPAEFAGTWVDPKDPGISYILGNGSFIYRFQSADRTYDNPGNWYRADSIVVLRFGPGSWYSGYNASATVRGDTLLPNYGIDAEWYGFAGGPFVRVRAP